MMMMMMDDGRWKDGLIGPSWKEGFGMQQEWNCTALSSSARAGSSLRLYLYLSTEHVGLMRASLSAGCVYVHWFKYTPVLCKETKWPNVGGHLDISPFNCSVGAWLQDFPGNHPFASQVWNWNHWNFMHLYVQFLMSCREGAVLMVWLTSGTLNHLVSVWKRSCFFFPGAVATNMAGKCLNVSLKIFSGFTFVIARNHTHSPSWRANNV